VNVVLDGSYQVSMPSSLRRRIEIKRFLDARDAHFAVGWRDHGAGSQKRSTIQIECSEDQHGRPVLWLKRPNIGQQGLRFFSFFSLADRGPQGSDAAFKRRKMRTAAHFGSRASNGLLNGSPPHPEAENYLQGE
jgi:hypothetical protein